jgi:hypothetical protein
LEGQFVPQNTQSDAELRLLFGKARKLSANFAHYHEFSLRQKGRIFTTDYTDSTDEEENYPCNPWLRFFGFLFVELCISQTEA